jgi:galactose-1-phosphate uridylyltransferase
MRFALPIHFESVTREASLLNPLKNFELDRQAIEHRRDPLTGRSVIVLKGRLEYVRRFLESDQTAIDELADSTQQSCPFCPDSVEKKAPKFPPEISAEGRIYAGEAVCFPSLFAHGDYNAIVVPTHSHKVALNQLSPGTFLDGLTACVDYFHRLHRWRPEVKNDAIIMNFYPPAGSTIAHPHIQALASDLPIRATHELVKASAEYFQEHRVSYWPELVESEKRLGERYIGRLGSVHWLTPFAPKGLNDAMGIVSGVSEVSSLTQNELGDIAKGIVKILGYYHDTGVRSFNIAIYLGPFGERTDYFDVNVRIVSRYGYKRNFVNDVWALQYLLEEQEVYEAPEETCSKLTKYLA